MTITLTREEAQQVLDALDFHSAGDEVDMKLIGMIRARLSAPESTAHFQFRGKMHVVCKCDKCVAQPEPEPVAWVYPDGLEALKNGKCWTAYGTHQNEMMYPLYTAPPQREWQGLMDEEVESLWDNTLSEDVGITALRKIARAIEAKLREKNGNL